MIVDTARRTEYHDCMNNETHDLTCVICGEPAITTAAHISVCEQHHQEYADEGRKYLPDSERVFWRRLQAAADERAEAERRIEAVGTTTIIAVDKFDVRVEAQAYVGGKVCNVVLGGKIKFSLVDTRQPSHDGGAAFTYVEVELSQDEKFMLHKIMAAAAKRALAARG